MYLVSFGLLTNIPWAFWLVLVYKYYKNISKNILQMYKIYTMKGQWAWSKKPAHNWD